MQVLLFFKDIAPQLLHVITFDLKELKPINTKSNNNTGIIFYGSTVHEVPPIKGDGRYTLTCFSSVQTK